MGAGKILVVPDSGLSNRMRAVVSATWLARACGREAVIVWHRYSGCNASLSDIFDTSVLPAHIIEPSALTYELLYDLPRKKNLFLPKILAPLKFKHRFYDAVNLAPYYDDGKALLKLVNDSRGDILFLSGCEFYDFPKEYFRQVIHPSQVVYNRATEILGSHQQPKYSIQIRRTDHRKAIDESPLSVFIDTIRQLDDAPFFLATDDDKVKIRLVAEFGDRVIYNGATASRSTPQGMIDAMAEIVIMSRCEHIYGSSGSSFPELASWLGDTPLTYVKKSKK